jgi:hypothetical protein
VASGDFALQINALADPIVWLADGRGLRDCEATHAHANPRLLLAVRVRACPDVHDALTR